MEWKNQNYRINQKTSLLNKQSFIHTVENYATLEHNDVQLSIVVFV